jgi:hypothetical protein
VARGVGYALSAASLGIGFLMIAKGGLGCTIASGTR